MLSVAIPALNEASNIASVIQLAKAHPMVSEVVVIDDGSIDDTLRIAQQAGAKVITSSLLGKGPSMRDALDVIINEYVLYLDADMRELDPMLFDVMLQALLDGADFVKARFSRSSGRVTELTAKPLLHSFFPELTRFAQPLGGIIAARVKLLQQLPFEEDFGVDVGLLIDAHFAGARIVEVDIGHVEHDSKPLPHLSRMAVEVSRTILHRAEQYGRLHANQLANTLERERQMRATLANIEHCFAAPNLKLALFDMDGTLLQGRFIMALAERAGFSQHLSGLLDRPELDAATRSNRIAALLRGLPQRLFSETARSMPLREDAIETIKTLRRAGYVVGIVSDSYFIAAETVRRRVFAQFAVGHILNFRNGLCSGELSLNPLFQHPAGCPQHPHCKRNVLQNLQDILATRFAHTLMVGDGPNDLCLIKTVDQGFLIGNKMESHFCQRLAELTGLLHHLPASAIELAAKPTTDD